MNYIVARWHCNYADEFDTDGFLITKKEYWNKFVESLTDEDCKQEFYFGTNESLEFDSKEDYLRHFKTEEVTSEEAQIIIKYLGEQYGTIIFPYDKEFIVWGEDPENDDDDDSAME